ncbi:hypothetical protein [Terriglobus roseus]|uniref:Uncharacterized protein n=1 Tax=Terriglobus roseus TaxID=392734 RepID=A0A1G7M609_9BACT|nr:hypothetical protein [Terriglobus roseus]SDF57207.1 hypothetical protein SAMN05444167_2712 [Terriglobus roseus]
MTSRRVLLFDPAAQPSSWNQRIGASDFAVHYSSFPDGYVGAPYCDVLASAAEAEAYAQNYVTEHPQVRCRVYDAHGLVGAPLFEVAGKSYKGESNLSQFRRWGGSVLFVVGSILFSIDVFQDYRLLWPSTIGSRLAIPGALLLVTEGLVVLTARHNAKKKAAATS